MAHEELQGCFCSSNSWSSSIRCGDILSCSMAAAAGDVGGSFGWFPAIDYQPQLSGFDPSPSSVDWSQSFLESSELMSHGFFAADEILLQPIRDDDTQMLSTIGFTSVVDDRSLFDAGHAGISQLISPTSMEQDDQNPKLHELTKASPTDDQQDLMNSSLFWDAFNSNGRSFTPSIINSDSTEKPNSKASRDSILPSAKKIRIETPSTMPTFKIRKEKLGDRITALQQLVSPFGKTDTASVLHEAVEYIKFLHEQVGALSSTYPRNGHQRNQYKDLTFERKRINGECTEKDLRSRGLCLVPFASMFVVPDEIPPLNFWAQLWREL